MEETLERSTLSHGDKSMLEKLLVKGPYKLEEDEIAIIRARRVYLTAVERKVFEEILIEKVEYSAMTKAQLLKVCAEKEIVAEPALKKAEIIALIEASEQE